MSEEVEVYLKEENVLWEEGTRGVDTCRGSTGNGSEFRPSVDLRRDGVIEG